jgi:hypothetical protein
MIYTAAAVERAISESATTNMPSERCVNVAVKAESNSSSRQQGLLSARRSQNHVLRLTNAGRRAICERVLKARGCLASARTRDQ